MGNGYSNSNLRSWPCL